MDVRHLRAAIAVARYGTFTEAASVLHVAQPAVSVTIRDLEAELGVRLFDRTSRRLVVTEAGGELVSRATRILDQLDELDDEMALFAGAVRGRVRVSTWYHFAPTMPTMIQDFIRDNPGVRITITELPLGKTIEAVKRGDIDLGFPILVPGVDLTGLDYRVVYTEQLALAIAREHPLAREPSITLEALAGIPLIMTGADTAMRGWLDYNFGLAGIRPEVLLETNEIAAAVNYASIGLGGTVLTHRIIEAIPRPVAIVPITGTPPFVMGLVWSSVRYRGPAAERLLAFAISSIARLPREGEAASGPHA